MNSTPRDAQAPRHRECLLPSVARTPSVTKVTPAKKITFLKRGDPQFAGVRLAVHQRAFKTFSALMDELSQRVPLSFGVRSVTTPRGLHSLSALEQLEDGGCYFCSDKKPPKTPSGPGQPQGRSPTAQQLRDIEGRREAPGTSSSRKSLKTPRRILLVKNMDPRLQQTVVLSHRNTGNLAAFLSKASDLLRFPVKQLYTTSGKKVDSLQALLHSPSVLVCAGHEAFRPPAMEKARRSEAETLSGLTSRNKNRSWGPKTKPSVIHSRSRPGSRPQLPDRPVPSNPPVGPAPDRHPQDTPAQPGPLVAGDDMKKKVRMNEDGSLSVEMKVRFHLVGEDTLLWSQRMGRASALTAASREDPILGEVDPLCCVWEGYPWGFSGPGVWGPRPCRVGCGEAFGRGGQPGPKYEIWTNPLHASQGERVATRKRWGLAQHVRCSGLWGHRAAGRERCSQDSASPASSTGHPEGSEPDSSCCPRTPEDGLDSGSPSAQRRAEREAGGSLGEDLNLCTDGVGLGSPEQGGRLTPRARSEEGASSDSLASTGSHEGSSEWGGRPRGCPGKARAETSQQEAIKGGNPGSPAPSLSSLRSEDLQAEMQGRSTEQARGASVKRERLVPGLSGSWDSEGASSTPSTSASSQQEQRRHRSRASATSSPSSPGVGRVAPRGHPRQCRYCKDTHNPLDSSVTKQVPRPPERRRACRDGSVPRSSGSSLSTRTQASGNLRPPSLGSLPSQDLLGISSATVTHAGHSDCASGVSPYNAPSVGWAGDAGSRTCSLDPTPPHTSDSCSKSGAANLGEQARDTPQPSSPLVLQVGWPEQGAAGPHQSCCHSQAATQPAEEAQRGPSPEALWLCGRYYPTPPRGRPCPQRRSSSCGSTGSSHRSAARGPGGSQQEEGTPQAVPTLSLGPSSGASRRSSASQDVGSGGLSQEETSRSWGGPQGQEEASGVSPSSLPRSSPEAVVREWLDNIPEEPVLMTYEMADETTGAARGGLRGPEVDPGHGHSLEGLGEPALAGQQPLEGDPGQDPEPEGALPGSSDAGPQSGEGVPQGAAPEGVSEAPAEAGADGEDPASCRVSLRALPGRVSASTQIMRALMGSKQGRPSSMPEVSRPMAKRLSRSAGALITCLASLQFFDEDLGSPASKVRFKDSPRYQELLSISKDLWPGCDLGEDQLDSGLWELTWSQALPDPGSHAGTENFTPTSSSGVDISSGSGGSGESSVPCAMDGTLVSEGTELPLKTSNQRPDSRTSENPGDLENQQQCCSPAFLNSQTCACATNEDEAERDSEEQRASSNLEQLAENTMQEEEVQLEESKEDTEGGGLQEEGVQLEETNGTEGEGQQEEAQLEEIKEETEGERPQEEGVQLEEANGTEGEGQQEEEAQLEEIKEETGGAGLQEEGAPLEETKGTEEGPQEEGVQLEETNGTEGEGQQEEEVQLEEIKEETEGERPQEEGVQLEGTKETEGERHQEEGAQSEETKGTEGEGQQEEEAQLEEIKEETGGAGLQEEGAPLEEVKEGPEGGLREEALEEGLKEEGLPEEGSVGRQELSEAGSPDGEGSREDDPIQEEEAGRAAAEPRPPEGTEEAAEPARHLRETDPRASESQSGSQLEPGWEKPPGAAMMGPEHAQAQPALGAAERSSSVACRAALDCDPICVSVLLKKTEKAFLAHLSGAVAELRARWGLQDSDLLDQMAAELQQDVARRLQDSTERELQKLQGRAGRMVLGPPREALTGELLLQTQQRRHRLRGLRNLSAFSERTLGLGPFSFTLEDQPALSAALGSQLGEDGEGEEFCPCEACVRKKVSPASPKATMGATRGPIKEAFDLQQILQRKREEHTDGEAAEVAPGETCTDPTSTRTVQGAGGGPGPGLDCGPEVDQGEDGEGSQRLDRDKDPKLGEAEGDAKAQKREGKIHNSETSVGSELGEAEQEGEGISERGETGGQGSGHKDHLQGEAVAGGDQDPGQSDGAESIEALEAEGEAQPESEGIEAHEAEEEAPEAEGEAQPESEGVEAQEAEKEAQPETESVEVPETEGEAPPESEGAEAQEAGEKAQEAEGEDQPESEVVQAPEIEGEMQEAEGEAQPESEGIEAPEVEGEAQGAEGEAQEAEGEAQPESEVVEAPEVEGEMQEVEGETQPESGVEAQEAEEEAQEAEEEAQEAEGEAQSESEGVEALEAEGEAQEAEGEAQPEAEGIEAQEAEGEAQPEAEGIEAQEAEEEAQPQSEGVEAPEAEGEAQEAEEEAQPESEGVEAPEAEGEAQEAEGEAQPESEGVEAPEAEGEAQEAEGEAQPESEGVEAPEAEGEAQEAEGEVQPEAEDMEAQEAEGEAQSESEGVEAQEAEGEAQPESEGVEALEAEGEAQPEAEGVEAPESEGVEAPEAEGEAQEAEGEAQPESEGVEAPEAEGEAQPEAEGVEAPEAEGEAQEAEGEAQPESEGVEAPEAEGEAQPEAEGVEAPEAEGEAQPEAEGVEALEAEGEAQPESEGETQGEKKGSPQVSLGDGQSEGPSESSSPVPEDRPTPPPSPGGDTPHQKPTFQTGPSSSRASSQGNSWRKDSEDGHVCGDTRSPDAKSMGAPHAERKATRMYPESSTSEQEEAPSDTRTAEQGAREGCDPQEDQTLGNPVPTKAVGRADGFGQDDLDF
ncbi:retinitis pigmentosa 1-like 1 protein [Trachypithecus francoisi]|uniref:retinitis pigmentosa 1-like 1 protein n=1 Tax=Trachypithecus francoisi TaxID=54180 RepID=UPI00141AAF64|nr:retinitis pigmentosa 1-like 1 protein [Trachypithecus francoisi]